VTAVARHEELFSFFTASERLRCGNLNFTDLKRLRESLDAMIERGSRLCYEDVRAAVEMIIECPFIGGHKGAMTIVDQLAGRVGETTYKEIKELLKDCSEDSFQQRKVLSELEANMYDRKAAKSQSSELIRSNGVHDVWSIDFTDIKVFGVRIYGCVVYDLYSQGYMAFEVSLKNDAEAACKAFRCALEKSGGVKPKTLVSDNGSHFDNSRFREAVGNNILHHFVAPGKPWLNGALESGNRDLKKMLYTQMFYKLVANSYVSHVGVSTERILSFVKKAADQAIKMINNQVVRPKFRVPPQVVIDGMVEQRLEEQAVFRNERSLAKMAMLKAARETGKKLKTLKQKVKRAWNSIVKKMSDDKLYAFRELINGRFQVVKC